VKLDSLPIYIQASEPIALYLGELTDELSLEGAGHADNTYLS
jgi:hypothetical protein